MAERIALVARELNRIQSVGEARAAVRAALGEIRTGFAFAKSLSVWSTPSPDEARTELAVLEGALSAEERQLAIRDQQAPIDVDAWPRTRRNIERAYVEVAGIEGVATAVERIDVIRILADAIKGAPKVFGAAVGDVVGGVGDAAGKLGGGFLGGLGLSGVLLLGFVLFLVLKVR